MDHATARTNMVESQVRTNKVIDARLIEALREIPRERFAPDRYHATAYVDEDLPLGGGRHMLEPMVLARLIQLATVTAEDHALNIGCVTGYDAAILARLANTVVAIDRDASMVDQARATLIDLGIKNVTFDRADMAGGYPRGAPYDVILMSGAVAGVPPAIFAQLAEGGRLVTVIKRGPGLGHATLCVKAAGVVSGRAVFDAGTPMLPGFVPQESFVF